MKRPLVVFALIFCAGVFVSPRLRIPFQLAYVLALAFLLSGYLTFKKGAGFNLFLSCFIFFFAMALHKNCQILPRCHISRHLSYGNNCLYRVKGAVNSRPLFKNKRVSFIFKTGEIQSDNLAHKTCGNILVRMRCKEDSPAACAQLRQLRYGQELILSGNLYRPLKLSSSGRQSYRDYLYNQGVFSVMNARSAREDAGLKRDKGLVFKRFAFLLKDKMEGIIFKRVSFVPASIMDAMILGERRNIPLPIKNSMMKSGTVHILVVSGFHVALISLIIIFSLKAARIPRGIRFYIAIPLIIMYCFMTGASTPVLRATIMAAVFMFACLIRREPDIHNSCALAAVSILAVNPRQLFDIGFQLSFASVISIACLYPRLRSLVHAGLIKTKYARFLLDSCLVSFSAWLGTAGLVAYYFRIISPVAVLANIFIVPLASLVTLCGLSLILMEFICPALVPLFARSSEFIVAVLLNINAFLIRLPCAYFRLS